MKIICTASAGFISGSTIWLNILNSCAPSILAASISSIGKTLSMYCLIKKNTIGDAIDGIISGINEFINLISPISLTNPNADTCVGTIIIRRMNVKANFLSLNSYA